MPLRGNHFRFYALFSCRPVAHRGQNRPRPGPRRGRLAGTAAAHQGRCPGAGGDRAL